MLIYMTYYVIVKCLRCGQPLIARAGQKTKSCTYCGRRLEVSKLRIFAKIDSSQEATRLVIAMKRPKTISSKA
jgi:DNA-directed RNA polymerase subunit RPC12/RpoP